MFGFRGVEPEPLSVGTVPCMTTSPDRAHGDQMFQAAGETMRTAPVGQGAMVLYANAQTLTLGAIYRELRYGHDQQARHIEAMEDLTEALTRLSRRMGDR